MSTPTSLICSSTCLPIGCDISSTLVCGATEIPRCTGGVIRTTTGSERRDALIDCAY